MRTTAICSSYESHFDVSASSDRTTTIADDRAMPSAILLGSASPPWRSCASTHVENPRASRSSRSLKTNGLSLDECDRNTGPGRRGTLMTLHAGDGVRRRGLWGVAH